MKSVWTALLVILCACSGTSARKGHRDAIAKALSRCDGCSIQVERLWSSLNDPNVLGAGYFVEVDQSLWAMGWSADRTVVRFDRLTGTSVAYERRGGGPGEFSSQVTGAALDPSGDTLVVAEARRVQYFSPQDFKAHRGFVPEVLVQGGGMLTLSDGSMVVTNTRPTSVQVLHRFNRDGGYLGSLLDIDQVMRGKWITIARGSEQGTVWVEVPHATGFSAQQWDIDEGRIVRNIQFDADWWHIPTTSPERVEAELAAGRRNTDLLRPESGVAAMRDDGSRLWVVVHQADPAYEDEVLNPSKDAVSHFNRNWDSFLIAFDRETGTVMTAIGFDDYVCGFTNLGNMVTYTEDYDGTPNFVLDRYRLVGAASAASAKTQH